MIHEHSPDDIVALRQRVSRRSLLKLGIAAGGIGAVGLILAACGSSSSTPSPQATTASSSTSSGSGSSTGGSSTPASQGSQSTSTTSTGKATSQTLRLTNTEPQHTDPGTTASGNEVRVVMAMYDGLLTYDVNGKEMPLCAEKWEASTDGITYTFHLRDGMKWTDGHNVTAGDFEYAWKRLADPALASEYAQASYVIKGAEDFNSGKTKDSSGVGVSAVDDKTLQVTLSEPAAYFLHVAATWSFMPVPKWAVDKFGAKWVEPGNVVSNGPFKLESWQHDQQQVLVRNDGYYGAKPALDKIVFTITADPTKTSIPAFENNEIDVTAQVTSADIDRLRGNSTESKELTKFPASSTTIIFFDTSNTNSPVSKPEVRKALYLAVDQNQIANDVFKGLYLPAPTVEPQGIAGYNPAAAPTGGVDEAKKLMTTAGYPGGKGFPQINLIWGQTSDYDLVAQVLQQMWQENLGISVSLQRQETKAFRSFFGSLSGKSVHYDMYIWGWGSDYEDPYNWFNLLWQSDQDFFRTRWKNDQYDTLVKSAAHEQDKSKRQQMYEQAEVLLMNEMPVLPLYHGANTFLVKPYVQNLHWPRVATTKFLQDVSIASH